MKRQILAMFLVVVMLFGLCACGAEQAPAATNAPANSGSQSSGETPAAADAAPTGVKSSKDTLVLRLDIDPGTLDNAQATVLNASQILTAVNCSLLATNWDENGNPAIMVDDRYSLATGYDFDADDMGMTWHIRQGIKWHDGTDMTMEDVLFSFMRYKDISRYNYIDFENIKVEGESDLHVPFFSKNAACVSDMNGFLIVPQHAVETIGSEMFFTSENFVGCGPYKMKSWTSGDSIMVTRNDDYFAGQALIENIVFRFMSEATVAMMEMETGGVDVVDIPAWTDVKNVLDGKYEGQIKHTSFGDLMIVQMGFDCSEGSVFNDLRVRQAICYALDRDALAAGAYEGVGAVAWTIHSNTFDNMKSYEGAWPYEKDIEKAKSLLAEAGVSTPIDLTLLTNQDANRLTCAEMVSNQLKEIGINISIISFDNATYASTMTNEKEKWDLWLRNWGGTGTFTSQFHNTWPTLVHPAESDPAYIKMMEMTDDCLQTLDPAERAKKEEAVQDVWMTEMLFTYPLVQTVKHILMVDNLNGLSRCGYSWRFLDAYFD